MGWIKDVVDSIFGLKTEDRKARAEEEKARAYAFQILNQEYRIKIDEQAKRIKELEELIENGPHREDIEISYEREIECHRQLIECAIKEKELKEEIIFLKIDLALLEKKVKRNGNGSH